MNPTRNDPHANDDMGAPTPPGTPREQIAGAPTTPPPGPGHESAYVAGNTCAHHIWVPKIPGAHHHHHDYDHNGDGGGSAL